MIPTSSFPKSRRSVPNGSTPAKSVGIQVVPSARAVNFTMNRKSIRDLAAEELGLKTAKYFYAKSFDELKAAAERIGFPCVVKPLMSSSGKGQSLVRTPDELEHAWEYGCSGSRGDIRELIIEEFIPFDSEITLLTVTQQNGPTLFCPPIGHVQKGGDYRESFQPAPISPEHLAEAQAMAAKVTQALTGAGLWGVEFFLSHDKGVYFSELSPRPHDTGMVTLAGTQNLNEFELHCRAVLGLPIPRITLEHTGASAVILSPIASREQPALPGRTRRSCREENTDLRIFGKPSTQAQPPHGRRRPLRRARRRPRRTARQNQSRGPPRSRSTDLRRSVLDMENGVASSRMQPRSTKNEDSIYFRSPEQRRSTERRSLSSIRNSKKINSPIPRTVTEMILKTETGEMPKPLRL